MKWDKISKPCYDVEHKIYQIYINNKGHNRQSFFIQQDDNILTDWLE